MDAIAYWEPKADTDRSEWEDGVAFDRRTGWFSVADGASTGGDSREWAHTLTSCFVRMEPASVFEAGVAGQTYFDAWIADVRVHFDEAAAGRRASKAPVWVQQASRREGAFATLLSGRIEHRIVRMIAVGDCCAFVVRDDCVVRSFPIEDPSEFGSAPALVGSSGQARPEARCRVELELDDGDELIVATDALADFLLRRRLHHGTWATIRSVTSSGFRDLVHDLRVERLMKNDDVTMLRCRPTPSARAGGG